MTRKQFEEMDSAGAEYVPTEADEYLERLAERNGYGSLVEAFSTPTTRVIRSTAKRPDLR